MRRLLLIVTALGMVLLSGVSRGQPDADSIRASNVATRLGQSMWRWTAFLEAPEPTLQQIECVEYTLHETFPGRVREVCNRGTGPQAFPLTVTGWGEFPLKLRIYFKDGSVHEMVHELKF